MKIKDYFILLLVFFILFLIGIYLKPLLMPPTCRLSPATRAKHDIEVMSKYLFEYYERNRASNKAPDMSDVVNFLENDCGNFSDYLFVHKPKTLGKYDFGVYLILPSELKSDAPTIIAYTTPLEKQKYIYRVALFLYGTEMSVILIENYNFEKMLDLNKLEETQAIGFYYFHSTQRN